MKAKRKQTAKATQAQSNRPPKSLRQKVRRALRKATTTRIGTLVFAEDGTPKLLLGVSSPDRSRAKDVYVWRADLPRGHWVECVVDRPIQMAEQPFFHALVESLAAAVHREKPLSATLLRHSPKGTRLITVDGEIGVTAGAIEVISRLLSQVGGFKQSTQGGSGQ